MRYALLIALLLISFSLGLASLGRLEQPVLRALYLHEVVWAVLAIGLLTNQPFRQALLAWVRRNRWWSGTLGWFWLTALLQSWFSQQLYALLFMSRVSLMLLSLILLPQIWRKVRSLHWSLPWLLTWGIGLSHVLFGLWQFFFLPDMRFLRVLGWDDHLYRAIGPLLDPNLTGLFILLWLIWLLSPQFKRWWRAAKHFRSVSIILAGLTLVLTFSRASYVAAVASLAIYLRPHHIKSKYWLLAGLALLPAIVFLIWRNPGGEGLNLGRTSSIVARIQADRVALGKAQPVNFLIGLPPATTESHAVLPNNLFLLLFHRGGVMGICLLMAGIWSCRRQLSHLDTAAVTLLLATVVHAQFNNSLFQPILGFWLIWLLTLPKPEIPIKAKTAK